MKSEAVPATVPEYVAGFPAPVRRRLTQMRKAIRAAAPDADEGISYRMPAYKLGGVLIYFAGFKGHIGMYPITPGVKTRFREELSAYGGSKGGVRFPHDEPLPIQLIEAIVRFRVAENAARSTKGRASKGAKG